MCPRVLHFRDFMYLRIRVRVVSVSVSVSVLHRLELNHIIQYSLITLQEN